MLYGFLDDFFGLLNRDLQKLTVRKNEKKLTDKYGGVEKCSVSMYPCHHPTACWHKPSQAS